MTITLKFSSGVNSTAQQVCQQLVSEINSAGYGSVFGSGGSVASQNITITVQAAGKSFIAARTGTYSNGVLTINQNFDFSNPDSTATLRGTLLHELTHAIYPNSGGDVTPHAAQFYINELTLADAINEKVDESDITYLKMDLTNQGMSAQDIQNSLAKFKSSGVQQSGSNSDSGGLRIQYAQAGTAQYVQSMTGLNAAGQTLFNGSLQSDGSYVNTDYSNGLRTENSDAQANSTVVDGYNSSGVNTFTTSFTPNASTGATGVTFAGKGDVESINNSSDGFASGASATIVGSSNTVALDGNTHDDAMVEGRSVVVTGDYGTNAVTLEGTDTTANVHGGGYALVLGNDDYLHDFGEGSISVGNSVKGVRINASYASIHEGRYDSVDVYGYGDHISTGGGDSNGGSYHSTGGGGAGYDGGGGDGGGGDSGGGDSGGGSSDDFVRDAKALKSPTTSAAHSSPLTQAETAAQATAGSTGSPNTSSSTASGHTSPMTQAELALARAQGAMNAEANLGVVTKPVFEGGKWKAAVPAGASAAATAAKPIITWSFADSPGTATDPFSGYLSAQYKATVEKAVQAWAVASGLTFKEVADSSSSDIRIGWGALDTSQSGLIGTTSYHETKGAMQAGTIIRLEDPSATPLVTGASGQLTYKGTGATLYQVALHEIGHALGLADDSDPSSVMYASSSNKNRKLDATDVKGIQSLYGSLEIAPTTAAASPISAAHASGVNQLIQAMATFAPKQATAPLSAVVAAASLAPTLATPARH